MRILSIDIGIIHLGMVEANICNDCFENREELIKDDEILMCELINITELVNRCRDEDCCLYHDKVICDYMSHLFKIYKENFENADIILIERQPLMGLCAVQEIIMMKYREKSKLISPNAMLNFFGILDYDYEIRKTKTEQIARPYLGSFKNFVFNERRHDLADGFCIMYYYLHLKRKENEENKKISESKKRFSKAYDSFKTFIYDPNL